MGAVAGAVEHRWLARRARGARTTGTELAAAAAEAAARATDDAEVNRAILARLEDIVKLLNHQR